MSISKNVVCYVLYGFEKLFARKINMVAWDMLIVSFHVIYYIANKANGNNMQKPPRTKNVSR